MGKAMIIAAALGLALAAPAVARETPVEQANAKVVLDFYAALNRADAAGTTAAEIKGIAERYLDPAYLQHSEMLHNLPGAGTDRDKLIRMFQSMPAMKALAAPKTEAIMAEGDRVMMLTSRTGPDPVSGKVSTSYIFNMFRVARGKLIEHWDVAPRMGPPPGMGGTKPPAGMAPPPGMPPMDGNGPPPGMPPPPGQ